MSNDHTTAHQAVAITGVAPVTAIGSGAETFWQRLVAGDCGIGKIGAFDAAEFPISLAAEVHDVHPGDWVDRRLLVQTDRWTHLALVATEMALADSGVHLDAYAADRVAVITASGSGGNAFGQREIAALWSKGPKAVTVYQSIAWFYAATTGQISIHHGSKGTCGVLASGGAGGIDALGSAAQALRSASDIVLVGATEAPISPYAMTCQLGMGELSTRRDPTAAYRPFGADADGYVLGEGGAMIVAERLADAVAAGRRPLALVRGCAATNDGRRRESDDAVLRGQGLAEAISTALARAGLSATDVDAVFADAMALPMMDQAEVAALRAVFGDDIPSVTTIKPAIGRMEAGASAAEVAAAVLALDHQVLPPAVNVGQLAPYSEIDLVHTARPARLDHVLVLGRGRGGFNAACVLGRAG